MPTRHSGYARAPREYYVEPAWAVDALFDHLPLTALHDPACGSGTIVTTAARRGIRATGADIVDRAFGLFPVINFLEDTTIHPAIVTNPPFDIAPRFVQHALDHVPNHGWVAIFAPDKFLHAQCRYALFTRPELDAVLVFSKRPSAPPGELLEEHGERIRGHGSDDFIWTIWQRGRRPAPPRMYWTLGLGRQK